MKRNGLQIAGGILAIIAGAFWLSVNLALNDFAKYFGLKLEMIQLILPVCCIICGASTCTGKRRKKDVITYAIVNIGVVLVQFYFGTYAGLGILQIVLLIISSLLYFISLKDQVE